MEEVDDQDLQDKGFEEEILEGITLPVLYEDENRPSSLPLPQSPASLAEPFTSSGGEGQHLAPAPSVLSRGLLPDPNSRVPKYCRVSGRVSG